MSENLHKVDDLFKGALEDHEEAPSPAVWNNLDQQLDKKNAISIYHKYRRLKWIAAASLMFALASGMYLVYTYTFNKGLTHRKQSPGTQQRKTIPPATNKEDYTPAQKSDEVKNAGANTQQQNLNNKAVGKNTPVAKITHIAASAVKFRGNKIVHAGGSLPFKHQYINNDPSTGKEVSKDIAKAKIIRSSHSERTNILASALGGATGEDDQKIATYKSFNVLDDLAVLPDVTSLSTIQSVNLSLEPSIQFTTLLTELTPQLVGKNSANKQRSSPLKSRFSVSVFGSPEFVSNHVVNDQKVYKEDDKREIQRTEKKGFSTSFGALINYNLNSNWSIQSGLTFSTTIKKIEKKGIYARPDNRGNVRYRFNCSSGYSYFDVKTGNNTPSSGDSLYALNSTNTLQYLGVPLAVQYTFTKSRWSAATNFGVLANILTKGRIETIIATGTDNEKKIIRDIHSLKPLYFSGIVGVSLGYKLNDKFTVFVNPRTKFALSSINKEGPVKTYQNSFGLAGGLNLTL